METSSKQYWIRDDRNIVVLGVDSATYLANGYYNDGQY